MSSPRISIVVPSYNQGQYLEETLNSIISQNYPNLELMVADGGSTDNSVEVIRKFENHLAWWVSEKDRGQSDAINKGLSRATGDVITWINSDDLLTPGTLATVGNYFSSLPEDVGLIHGGVTLFKGDITVRSDWGYRNPGIDRYLSGMAFSQPSAFFRKKYLDEVGGRLMDELHYGMDYELFSRLSTVTKFQPVQEIFALYRLHDTSKSIADQHKFIHDWSRVYVNLAKNLGWKEQLEKMMSIGVFDQKVFDWHKPFHFQPRQELVSQADREKILFHHLTYAFKDFYWTGNLKNARIMLRFLKKNYSKAWLNEAKDVPPMMKKLLLPDSAIRSLKFVLRTIRKIKRKL